MAAAVVGLLTMVAQVVLAAGVVARSLPTPMNLNSVLLADRTEATAAILITAEAQDKGLPQESLGKQAQPCILAAVAVVPTLVLLVRTVLAVLAAAVTETMLALTRADILELPIPAVEAADAPTAAPPARAAAASLSSARPRIKEVA